jgi:hypothetical protein
MYFINLHEDGTLKAAEIILSQEEGAEEEWWWE